MERLYKNKYKYIKMIKKTVDNIEKGRYNEVEARGKQETESFEGV